MQNVGQCNSKILPMKQDPPSTYTHIYIQEKERMVSLKKLFLCINISSIRVISLEKKKRWDCILCFYVITFFCLSFPPTLLVTPESIAQFQHPWWRVIFQRHYISIHILKIKIQVREIPCSKKKYRMSQKTEHTEEKDITIIKSWKKNSNLIRGLYLIRY